MFLAAEAEILLFGWISLVDGSVASAAFLLRVLGEMMTGDSEATTESKRRQGVGWDLDR